MSNYNLDLKNVYSDDMHEAICCALKVELIDALLLHLFYYDNAFLKICDACISVWWQNFKCI